jgi:hypothetical protein
MIKRSPKGAADAGFLLVEALVALAVSALLASALIGAFWQAGELSAEASARAVALSAARGAWANPCAAASTFSPASVTFEASGVPGLRHVRAEVGWRAGRRSGIVTVEGVAHAPCEI